jgi:hypothetical protein
MGIRRDATDGSEILKIIAVKKSRLSSSGLKPHRTKKNPDHKTFLVGESNPMGIFPIDIKFFPYNSDYCGDLILNELHGMKVPGY